MSIAYQDVDRHASLAQRLNAELRRAEPQVILQAALDALGDQVALVSSFGAESVVLLHLVAVVSSILMLWIDRRGTQRPLPKLELRW